jgi:hypothetical protein
VVAVKVPASDAFTPSKLALAGSLFGSVSENEKRGRKMIDKAKNRFLVFIFFDFNFYLLFWLFGFAPFVVWYQVSKYFLLSGSSIIEKKI